MCFVGIAWKERPPFLLYPEVPLTQKALPLLTMGLPFCFGRHLGGCHFMNRGCHFMGVSCHVLKHHTALCLADSHCLPASNPRVLRKPYDWLAKGASPPRAPRSTSAKEAPCHYVQGGRHFWQPRSPHVFVLHCGWVAAIF